MASAGFSTVILVGQILTIIHLMVANYSAHLLEAKYVMAEIMTVMVILMKDLLLNHVCMCVLQKVEVASWYQGNLV